MYISTSFTLSFLTDIFVSVSLFLFIHFCYSYFTTDSLLHSDVFILFSRNPFSVCIFNLIWNSYWYFAIVSFYIFSFQIGLSINSFHLYSISPSSSFLSFSFSRPSLEIIIISSFSFHLYPFSSSPTQPAQSFNENITDFPKWKYPTHNDIAFYCTLALIACLTIPCLALATRTDSRQALIMQTLSAGERSMQIDEVAITSTKI